MNFYLKQNCMIYQLKNIHYQSLVSYYSEKLVIELEKPMTIYLFGGENMRIKSLKDSTKDCDIVVETKGDFDDLAQTLTNMTYDRRLKTKYSDEDRRIKPR